VKKVTWREVECWGLQEGEEFENFGCECLITVSVLLQKISLTFKGAFWNTMWWYFVMLHDTLSTGKMPLTYKMSSIILVYTEYLLVTAGVIKNGYITRKNRGNWIAIFQ
jgi:hypothetical protein